MNPGSGKSPGKGNGNPLQLVPGKSHTQVSLKAMVHGVAKSQKPAQHMIYNWLPWWRIDKESSCQHRRCGFNSWRRKWKPTLIFFPGKSHWQRSLVGYSPWGCKRVRHDLETKQKTITCSFIYGQKMIVGNNHWFQLTGQVISPHISRNAWSW